LCLSAASLPATTAPSAENDAPPLPGVELAEAVATASGVAITPLFGLATVGAWTYYKTPEVERADLPWFANPYLWIPGLLLTLLLLFKEPVLGWIPLAKKPLDAMVVLESKASALLAAPVVVPMFLEAFISTVPNSGGSVAEAWFGIDLFGVVAVSLGSFGMGEVAAVALVLPLFVAAFFSVWLAFHAINVLVLLSPFGVLDTALRSIKFIALASIAAAFFIHPYLGMLVVLGIVLVSIPIACWSFRLSVFGSCVAFDLLSLAHRRVDVDSISRFRVFSGGGLRGVPVRTAGLLDLSESAREFVYRKFAIGPRVGLPVFEGEIRIGRGILCPTLFRVTDTGVEPLLRFAPRLRPFADELAARLGLEEVDDHPVQRGLKGVLAWVRQIGGRSVRAATDPLP